MPKKRKLIDVEDLEVERPFKRVKRVNKNKNVDRSYHTATGVHNFMLNDPIVDWIKYNNFTFNENENENENENRVIRKPKNKQSNTFFSFITQKGCEFETQVIKLIKEKLYELENPDGSKIQMLTISNSREDVRSRKSYKKTIEAMKEQVPVIYQGVLHGNDDFKCFGCPDLLIRSDIINFLTDTPLLTEEDVQTEAPLLGDSKFHYRVIDVKFCTMMLRADGENICNNGKMPAYKGQLYVYNKLLEITQGYFPESCYILGRAWTYKQKGSKYECLRCDERLGTINFNTVDNFYPNKVNKALKWLDKLKNEGKYWDTFPSPSVPELYPNMCNKTSLYYVDKMKIKIAREIDDITLLWNCGVKQRDKAHAAGIFKLTDRRLTTKILGFPDNTPRTMLIDKMLKFNQGLIGENNTVIPKYIDNNPYDWQRPNTVEFFLDFENFSNIFDNFKEMPNRGGINNNKSLVFMIGLGVSIRENRKIKWEYHNFRITDLTNESEYNMFNAMYEKIEEILENYEQDAEDTNVYHWGNIEKSIIRDINMKYEYKHDWENKFSLVDFNKIFKDEGILIKGVYGFGLKQIGNSLIKHNLIKINGWDDSTSNGLDAMIQAFNIYRNLNNNNNQKISNLIRYNEVDVRMIEKIINYLRKYHTPGIIRKTTDNILTWLFIN